MELTFKQALQQGAAAHNQGDLQEAERLYRAILQALPAHPEANYNLGLIAISVNKVEAALPLFKIAVRENPKIEQFWLSYIETLIKDNQFEEAQRVIKGAKTFFPLSEKLDVLNQQSMPSVDESIPPQTALNELLDHYHNLRYEDAESLAKSITNQFPNHLFTWKILAATLQHTERLAESITISEKIVALAPQNADAHFNLARGLKELGRFEEAEGYLEGLVFV